MARAERFVAESIKHGFTLPYGLPPRLRGHLTLCLLHRHVGFTPTRSVLRRRSRAFPAPPPTTMTSAETPLRLAPSPFQAQGGASPGKGRTPSSHNRHIYATSP